MLTKNHLAALNVAYKIASVVSALKVAALVANTGYEYYYGTTTTTTNTTEANKKNKNVNEVTLDNVDAAEDVKEDQEPDSLVICPITDRPIRVPASTRYGNLFELSAIEDYVRKHGKCPLTDQALTEDEIFPQPGLQANIQHSMMLEHERMQLRQSLEQLSARVQAREKKGRNLVRRQAAG